MWLQTPLTDVLSSPAKVAVLRTLCRVNRPLSGREIIRRAAVTYGPGWQALQALVASGVLAKRQHGRVNTYELRGPDLALTRRLRDLFAAEDTRTRDAASDLAKGVPEALSIVLFGSEARGEARPGSDTDVLVVVARRNQRVERRVRQACLAIAERHNLALSWQVADLQEIRDWETTGNAFWQQVLRDGIVLHGERPEVLRRQWQTGEATDERPAGSGR